MDVRSNRPDAQDLLIRARDLRATWLARLVAPVMGARPRPDGRRRALLRELAALDEDALAEISARIREIGPRDPRARA